MKSVQRSESSLIALAKKLSKNIPFDPSLSYVFLTIGKKIRKEEDFFRSFSTTDLIKIGIYAYSLVKTNSIETAKEIINNSSIIYLFKIDDLEKTEELECEECSGSGRITCNLCDGAGGETCDKCDGDETVECEECEGEGTDEEGNTCDNCGGRGEIDCDSCDGGNVECRGCSGYGDEQCEYCDDASGYLRSDKVEYYTRAILNWDNNFTNECDIKMELREPVDFDTDQPNQIELLFTSSYEEFIPNIEEDEFYCFLVERLNESTLKSSTRSPYLLFTSEEPSDYIQ
jgi:hypothetical protein